MRGQGRIFVLLKLAYEGKGRRGLQIAVASCFEECLGFRVYVEFFIDILDVCVNGVVADVLALCDCFFR
jgi:hypothetical protein